MNKNSFLEDCLKLFEQLPGIGPRSSRRIVLHLLKNRDTILKPMHGALKNLADEIKQCELCFNLSTSTLCEVCSNENRDNSTICIVDDISSLWALEKISGFKGKYHVLNGLLSSVLNTGPAKLRIPQLKDRISTYNVKEVIMALPLTTEGQITMYYILEELSELGVKITTLGQGVPMGGELDYLDEGTLSIALKSRHEVK